MSCSESIKMFRSELMQQLNNEFMELKFSSHAGYSTSTVVMYSSATTKIWAFTYRVNKQRYADLYVVCIPGKEYYTSKSQIMNEYFPTLLKRFEKCVKSLRNSGYKVTSSQIVFVGNFSSDLIDLIKETKELFGVKTSMRALPIGKARLFHRIRGFIVKSKSDVFVALLYWVGAWFRERWSSLVEYLKKRGEDPRKNKLALIHNHYIEKIMVKISMLPGDVLALLEGPPPR